ncbi:hypothetical protein KJZ63_00775 [Patescibacteria group bacterium]|nr:hypothetical protein [Patescibacteria group bacterium]
MDNIPPQLNQSTGQVTAPTPEEKEAALKASEKIIPVNSLNGSLAPAAPIQLANTPETDLAASAPSGPTKKDLADLLLKYGPKMISIGLTIQSLRGIYKSVAFILVDYPLLEQKLVNHQITEAEVTELTIMMVIMLISTVIGLAFAMRLAIVKDSAAKRLHSIIGLILFFGNAYIHDLLQALHISEWLVQFFAKSVQTIHEAPKQVIENTPFLEENAQGGLDTVWYK